MTYKVFIVSEAKLRIFQQAEYIATEQGAPHRAETWLERVFDKAEGLAEMPRRYTVALEDAWCSYEVRHIPIGQFVLFFTIVEETKTIWVIHARHGRQLSRPADFPELRDDLPPRAD